MNRKMRVLSYTLLPLLLVACGHGEKGGAPRTPDRGPDRDRGRL